LLVVFLGIVPFYPNAIECHYAQALGWVTADERRDPRRRLDLLAR
jgi:hypothetical protein